MHIIFRILHAIIWRRCAFPTHFDLFSSPFLLSCPCFFLPNSHRMQLIRTTMDIFRIVPLAIFVIVPFMEFLLPVALKLFPNMLPSTFQDNLKKEENMKRELQMRLAVAGFMQETLAEMASKKKASGKSKDGEPEDASGAKEVIDFIDKARLGEPLPKDSVIRIAR